MEAGEGCEDMVSGGVVFFYYFPSISIYLLFVVLLFVCAHMMVSLCKTLVNVGIKRMILKTIMQLLIKWCSIPGVSFMHQVSKYTTQKLTSVVSISNAHFNSLIQLTSSLFVSEHTRHPPRSKHNSG